MSNYVDHLLPCRYWWCIRYSISSPEIAYAASQFQLRINNNLYLGPTVNVWWIPSWLKQSKTFPNWSRFGRVIIESISAVRVYGPPCSCCCFLASRFFTNTSHIVQIWRRDAVSFVSLASKTKTLSEHAYDVKISTINSWCADVQYSATHIRPHILGYRYFFDDCQGRLSLSTDGATEPWPIVRGSTFLNIGSRPSDHYFRSVCLFACLFVCAVFLSRLWSDFDQISTHDVWV